MRRTWCSTIYISKWIPSGLSPRRIIFIQFQKGKKSILEIKNIWSPTQQDICGSQLCRSALLWVITQNKTLDHHYPLVERMTIQHYPSIGMVLGSFIHIPLIQRKVCPHTQICTECLRNRMPDGLQWTTAASVSLGSGCRMTSVVESLADCSERLLSPCCPVLTEGLLPNILSEVQSVMDHSECL